MFCTNCGNKINEGVKFCTYCGHSAGDLKAQPVVIKSSEQHKLFQDNNKSNTSGPLGYNPPIPSQGTTNSFGSIAKKINTSKAIQIIFVLALVGYGIYSNLDKSSIDTNNTAITAYDTGNTQQAISQFQQASNDAVTNDTKISTLKNLAYVYSSENKDDLALSTFKQALALTSPGSFDYYLISGEVDDYESNADAAKIDFEKAYKINPNDFQINNALALFDLDLDSKHPKLQDYKMALVYAQKASGLSSLEIAKQNLGLAYFFNDNYTQAISILSNITLDKNTYTAYWLGLSYAGNDDTINAKLYLQTAINNGVKVPQNVKDYISTH